MSSAQRMLDASTVPSVLVGSILVRLSKAMIDSIAPTTLTSSSPAVPSAIGTIHSYILIVVSVPNVSKIQTPIIQPEVTPQSTPINQVQAVPSAIGTIHSYILIVVSVPYVSKIQTPIIQPEVTIQSTPINRVQATATPTSMIDNNKLTFRTSLHCQEQERTTKAREKDKCKTKHINNIPNIRIHSTIIGTYSFIY